MHVVLKLLPLLNSGTQLRHILNGGNYMKDKILSEIYDGLLKLGISMERQKETDISISTEFLDAKWGIGKKKIFYESYIYANEEDETVYMYEKTTQTGGGFSFGSESNNSFQFGKTLFSKVKSTQYDATGKVYEISLNLGDIPKTVKEIAQNNGWKFKTVINKRKALY